MSDPPSSRQHWRHGSVARYALAISFFDAAVAGVMSSVLDIWLSPLLQLRLEARASVIGLVTILPMLGMTVLGPFMGPVIRFLGGARRCTLLAAQVQIMCLAAMGLPIYFPDQLWALPSTIALAVIILIAGIVSGTSWQSWMGQIIPRSIQGRYLSRRVQAWMLVRLAFSWIFAGVLSWLPGQEMALGFHILIAAAALARWCSWWLLTKQPPPPPRPAAGPHSRSTQAIPGGFPIFLRRLRHTEIGRWTLVWATLNLGLMVAGPFFSPYMLAPVEKGGLGLNPLQYNLLTQINPVVMMITFPLFGRLVDLYGPTAILRLAVAGITVIPVGWALFLDLRWLIAIEVVSGLSWAMASSAMGVLILSCHRDPEIRARLIGYHQTVMGMTIVFASSLGSALVDWLPPFFGSSYRSLFLVSFALRLPAVILAMILLPKLRDLRAGELTGLWRYLPGSGLVVAMTRELTGFFRQPDAEE
jgi:MFS family permease